MFKETCIYRGNVYIHLQGQNALLPIHSAREDQITCFIGSRNRSFCSAIPARSR